MRSFVLLVAALSAACFIPAASLKDVESEHAQGGGTTRIVDAPADAAYACAAQSLRWEGADRLEEHDKRNVMADIGRSGGGGTVVGAWIEPSGTDHAKVTVVTKRAARTIDTLLTEGTWQDDITKCLAFAKRGEALPAKKP